MHSHYDNLVPRLEVLKGTGIKINSALDIGANTGQWFSLFTSIFTQTKVTSVEASPATYEILKNTNPNSILSCLGNPTSDNQTVDFWVPLYSEICAGSSYYKEDTPWYKDSYKKTLPLEKLDNLFPNSVFDYVKLDTQGSELDIILGGKTLIEKAMVVECEVSILDYNSGGCLFYDILRIMDELDFRVFDYTALYYWNNRLNQMNLIFLKKNNPLFMLENDTIPE